MIQTFFTPNPLLIEAKQLLSGFVSEHHIFIEHVIVHCPEIVLFKK
jgi:hypothetical protein